MREPTPEVAEQEVAKSHKSEPTLHDNQKAKTVQFIKEENPTVAVPEPGIPKEDDSPAEGIPSVGKTPPAEDSGEPLVATGATGEAGSETDPVIPNSQTVGGERSGELSQGHTDAADNEKPAEAGGPDVTGENDDEKPTAEDEPSASADQPIEKVIADEKHELTNRETGNATASNLTAPTTEPPADSKQGMYESIELGGDFARR